jgi:Sulfotransferase family
MDKRDDRTDIDIRSTTPNILTACGHMTAYPRPDVLHIGYPRAASSFIFQYLQSHSQVTTDSWWLGSLLSSESVVNPPVVVDKPCANKIHVTRDENVAEAVCITGDKKKWQRYIYVPGAWDAVKDDVIVDPREAALRLHKVLPDAKILLLIRKQDDWLGSVYKYVMSQLPAKKRSFVDYCTTPSGIVHLNAGHFDRTIEAYFDIFGSRRVRVLRFEDIQAAPKRFLTELCGFIGISEQPMSLKRANDTHALIAKIQRRFPLIERVPRPFKDVLKTHAPRLLPGARGSILPSRDIRTLRSMYAASNGRTERLLSLL